MSTALLKNIRTDTAAALCLGGMEAFPDNGSVSLFFAGEG